MNRKLEQLDKLRNRFYKLEIVHNNNVILESSEGYSLEFNNVYEPMLVIHSHPLSFNLTINTHIEANDKFAEITISPILAKDTDIIIRIYTHVG